MDSAVQNLRGLVEVASLEAGLPVRFLEATSPSVCEAFFIVGDQEVATLHVKQPVQNRERYSCEVLQVDRPQLQPGWLLKPGPDWVFLWNLPYAEVVLGLRSEWETALGRCAGRYLSRTAPAGGGLAWNAVWSVQGLLDCSSLARWVDLREELGLAASFERPSGAMPSSRKIPLEGLGALLRTDAQRLPSVPLEQLKDWANEVWRYNLRKTQPEHYGLARQLAWLGKTVMETEV